MSDMGLSDLILAIEENRAYLDELANELARYAGKLGTGTEPPTATAIGLLGALRQLRKKYAQRQVMK